MLPFLLDRRKGGVKVAEQLRDTHLRDPRKGHRIEPTLGALGNLLTHRNDNNNNSGDGTRRCPANRSVLEMHQEAIC